MDICTAIRHRASTGPEQGFLSVVFPHREKPVFITEVGLQRRNPRFGKTYFFLTLKVNWVVYEIATST